MKEFIYKSALFVTVFMLLVFLISRLDYYKKSKSSDYMAAMQLKHARFDSIGNQPHIVFTGASSLAFGINSGKIQDHFQVPVTNMGLHAGLGYDFILEEMYTLLEEERTFILSLEPTILEEGDLDLKKNACRYYPDACNYFQLTPFQQQVNKVAEVIHNFQNNINYFIFSFSNKESVKAYTVAAFNEYGDFTWNTGNKKKMDLDKVVTNAEDKALALAAAINQMNERCKRMGVKCYFMPCPIASSYRQKNEEAFNTFFSTFNNEVEMKMIGDFEGSIYPDSLFYDSQYHLNQEGAKLKTQQLIKDMEAAGL